MEASPIVRTIEKLRAILNSNSDLYLEEKETIRDAILELEYLNEVIRNGF